MVKINLALNTGQNLFGKVVPTSKVQVLQPMLWPKWYPAISWYEVEGVLPYLAIHYRFCFAKMVRQPRHPGGVLPYIRYIGMCRPKGYGF